MKPFYLIAGGMLAAMLAGGAAAQFNPDALKKMQKEGHKIVEEQQAAEAAKSVADTKAAADTQGVTSPAARHAYRTGTGLCLDARGALAVRPCAGKIAAQQWGFDPRGRLVAHDGRCLDGASLATCAGGATQKWIHDKRGRLRNQAKQCLRARNEKAGAPLIAAPCSGAPALVWVELDLPG